MPKKMTQKIESTEPSAATLDKIKPIHQLDNPSSVLVYGRSGTGKTAFAGTMPKPTLLLDVREHGTDTIARIPGIDVISIEKWSEVEEIYWFLQSAGKQKYKSVVIDQITQLQELVMDSIRKEEGLLETDLISKRIWGSIAGRMKTWLFNYRDLTLSGLHVLMVAHDRLISSEEATEDQIDPSVGPRLMPSVSSAISAAVNVVGNTFIREVFDDEQVRSIQYCMRIGPHPYYVTKIRQPFGVKYPDLLVNPTFEKLQALSRGEELPKRVVAIKRSK